MNHLILIVEDDKDLSHLLGLYLRSKGFSTVSFESIKDTESFLIQGNPSMLLLDNHLDDGIAIDYIEKFKASNPGLPIILMTADFVQDIKSSDHYASLDGVLLKPFSPESLNQILETIH